MAIVLILEWSYYVWYYIVLVVLQRKRCDGTMELDVFCLGCGCKTSKGDGRVLCNDAAPNALPMWEKIIDAKLQKLGKEADKQALN